MTRAYLSRDFGSWACDVTYDLNPRREATMTQPAEGGDIEIDGVVLVKDGLRFPLDVAMLDELGLLDTVAGWCEEDAAIDRSDPEDRPRPDLDPDWYQSQL